MVFFATRMWTPVASLVLMLQHSVAAVPMAVAGYLPEWRFEGENWDAMCQTYTHLIIFSLEPSKDGKNRSPGPNAATHVARRGS